MSTAWKHTTRALALLAGVILAALAVQPAQAQDLTWVKQAGGAAGDAGHAIAMDGSGNSYVTGTFGSSALFGAGEANETTLTAAARDIFVAKYDAAGALVWAKKAGGTLNDVGLGIAVDGSGNSYVTGLFWNNATFGAGETNETVFTGTAGFEIFVAKYDTDGALIWAKRAGGTALDVGNAIAVDGSGNSYVTGYFAGTATFGPGEGNETILTSAGGSEIFVAKYDTNGALLWAKKAGGTADDQGLGIAVDGTGASYVTGYFADSATFGPGEGNETTLTSAGLADIFLAKYDANGMLIWAKKAGGSSADSGNAIALDGSGNSYVTGQIIGSAVFAAGEPNETTLAAAGGDIFVAKYDAAGVLIWAKKAGGTFGDVGYGIVVDGSGVSCVTGTVGSNGSAVFGAGEANETTLNGAGGGDVFVAQYDASGSLIWAVSAGSGIISQQEGGYGAALDASGNCHVAGYFVGSATFGAAAANQATTMRTEELAETTLISAGLADIFVAQFGNTPLAITVGYFRADRNGDTLDFHWQTLAETGTAGFNLLAVTPRGNSLLNDQLIPSTVVDAVTPTDYRFRAATTATQFYLQELSVRGSLAEHGPFDLGVTYGVYSLPADWEPATIVLLPVIVR